MMTWISVDERTPNNYETVLVCFNNGNKPGIDIFTWNDKWYKANKITHWMPLPKAPN